MLQSNILNWKSGRVTLVVSLESILRITYCASVAPGLTSPGTLRRAFTPGRHHVLRIGDLNPLPVAITSATINRAWQETVEKGSSPFNHLLAPVSPPRRAIGITF